LPSPVFEDGAYSVMQRGAGMCTVKSDPKREKAAVTFLKWMTAPQRNTQFVVDTGYMPVTQEAFDSYLTEEIQALTEQKYVELYNAYADTQKDYAFYAAPQFDGYLEIETAFEENVRLVLQNARKQYIEAGGNDPELLDKLVEKAYTEFMESME